MSRRIDELLDADEEEIIGKHVELRSRNQTVEGEILNVLESQWGVRSVLVRTNPGATERIPLFAVVDLTDGDGEEAAADASNSEGDDEDAEDGE